VNEGIFRITLASWGGIAHIPIESHQIRRCFKNHGVVDQGCPILVLDGLWPAQPQSNTPAQADNGLTRHNRHFQTGVLRQVGAKLCRTVTPSGAGLDTPGVDEMKLWKKGCKWIEL